MLRDLSSLHCTVRGLKYLTLSESYCLVQLNAAIGHTFGWILWGSQPSVCVRQQHGILGPCIYTGLHRSMFLTLLLANSPVLSPVSRLIFFFIFMHLWKNWKMNIFAPLYRTWIRHCSLRLKHPAGVNRMK